jgi:two-component system phosphate regulon response regulator PhoB
MRTDQKAIKHRLIPLLVICEIEPSMSVKTQPTVLVVEDEPAQREVLAYNLEAEGFRVVRAENGEEALLLVSEENPDIIILDWMMPHLSGIEVCRRLKTRSETRAIPIMMLSARSEDVDKVRGLETGADDYVVKPYSVIELMARVRAQLRRIRPATVGERLEYEDIVLDSETHRVTRSGTELKLGPTEFRLLSTFMEKPGRVWSRDQLLDRVWGRDIYVDTRTVDVHIGRLRKALMHGGGSDPLRTVRGSGYALG